MCLGAAKGRDVTWGAGAGELGSDRLLQTQRERGSPEEETRASLPGLGTGTIGAVGGEHSLTAVQQALSEQDVILSFQKRGCR